MFLHPDFIEELRKHFTGDIRLDTASRLLYSTDASIYQIEPLGVAIPKTQEDLHAALELAAKYKVPILPRGTGSSLAGQAIGEALILDCSRWLDSIVSVDPDSHSATVEPGVVLTDLNRAAAKFGLTFGPDPASAERATMGGVIANNATGAHSILYGMTADHLISADVILSDGSLATFNDYQPAMPDSRHSAIVSVSHEIRGKYADAIKGSFPKSWRNSAGYRLNYLLPWSPSAPPQWASNDFGLSATVYRPSSSVNLASLLAGSEGTLAVIRRATVNLVPKPKHTILGILAYESIAQACDDIPRLLEFRPSAVELVPRMILRLARAVPAYSRQMGWLTGDPAAILVVEFGGDRPDVLQDSVSRIGDLLALAESAEDQARVWNVRKVGLGILDSRPQSARPAAFIEDCAIPVDRLAEFIREVERILREHKTEGGIYAHASAGCLHIRPILDLKSGEGVRSMRKIAAQTLALTLRMGGSMSSEHGDGIARGEWLKQTYGGEVVTAMRALKQAADPYNLLNPYKMFDAPPMDSHLRYGTGQAAQAWTPAMDFSRNGGLVMAIEQCNGQGVCRKSTGVMCPSYQATREEANSTRGRANLLRALIARPQRLDAGLSSETFNALDLCLACKGCKSECPSGVDMAKLKFAFMHEYYRTHPRPLRDYLFGYFHIAARLLSAIAPIVNWLMRIELIKSLVARVLKITPHRPFPKFTTRRAQVVRIGRETPMNKGFPHAPRVIFLSDAFSHYVEPQIEQAAFDILSRLGFEVLVLPVIGAGAALISKSFLDAAKKYAARVLDALNLLDPDGILPVVGIEPPELYALKNDYVDLLPDRRGEILHRAERTWLLEEYLIRSDIFNNLRVANNARSLPSINHPKLKLQPHCHQRAEAPAADGLPTGTAATVSLLQGLSFEVEVIDSGCCGMAGTFGYEAEHYKLSMQVGELKLFPFLRKFGFANRESVILGTGAACRMQIIQGTGLAARHPLEMVAERLKA